MIQTPGERSQTGARVFDRRTPGRTVSQACDGCRLRKTKCHRNHQQLPSTDLSSTLTQAIQCARCAKLQLACTYHMPINARGPKPKHRPDATLAQQSSMSPRDGDDVRDLCHNDSLSSPTTLQGPTSSPHDVFDDNLYHMQTSTLGFSNLSPEGRTPNFLDALGPKTLVAQIMDDYLEYLYPLIPIVHRPSFLAGLQQDRYLEDKDFLTLLLAIVAAVVGTMPSKFEQYRISNAITIFSSRKATINYCYASCMSLRTSAYFDEINFQKWAASYLIQVALFQIGEHNRARMGEVECMQLARLLGFHNIDMYVGLNPIETQLRKKGFWLLFYAYVHSQLQNLRKERLTFLDPITMSRIKMQDLMPLEVDDEVIFEDGVDFGNSCEVCLTTGFVYHSSVFWTALQERQESSSMASDSPLCPCVRNNEPSAQLQHLEHRLQDLRYMLDDIPPALRQWISNSSSRGIVPDQDHQHILHGQFESVRANIHVTHLWLQSILIDQLDALLCTHPHTGVLVSNESAQKTLWNVREDISRQLLHLLDSISKERLEPNGLHLAYKVRDVAVGLLSCPFGPDEPASKRASSYVREFTCALAALDESETVSTVSLQTWVDTDRTKGVNYDSPGFVSARPSPWG